MHDLVIRSDHKLAALQNEEAQAIQEGNSSAATEAAAAATALRGERLSMLRSAQKLVRENDASRADLNDWWDKLMFSLHQ